MNELHETRLHAATQLADAILTLAGQECDAIKRKSLNQAVDAIADYTIQRHNETPPEPPTKP